MDVQPLAGDDFQSLLTMLPEHHPRAGRPAAHQGRRPDHRRPADQQRQPQRSVDGRLRSRAAERRGRVGRGAVESVRRRVRPLLDQRDAGPHQARHQRLDRQAGQPHARLRQGVRLRQQIRAAAVDLRPAQARPAAVSASTCSIGSSGRRSRACPASRRLGLDSFDSFTRLDAVLSSRHALTGGVIYFPRKITNADAVDVPAAGDDAEVHAGRLLGRGRSIA